MVSGFVTSPELQERICFEEARPISIASKLLMSIMGLGLSFRGLVLGQVLIADDGCPRRVTVDRGLGGVLVDLDRLVGGRAVGRAHAGEVDAQLLGRAQEVVVLV